MQLIFHREGNTEVIEKYKDGYFIASPQKESSKSSKR